MKVIMRICLKDWEITAKNGDRCKLTRGTEYTTSPDHDDGTCTVFTNYWVRVPLDHFGGEEPLNDRIARHAAT